jgi:hypothetical protein
MKKLKSSFHNKDGVLKPDLQVKMAEIFDEIKETGSGMVLMASFDKGTLKTNSIGLSQLRRSEQLTFFFSVLISILMEDKDTEELAVKIISLIAQDDSTEKV